MILEIAEHHACVDFGHAGGEARVAEIQLDVAEGRADLQLGRHRPGAAAFDVAQNRADAPLRDGEARIHGQRRQRRARATGRQRRQVGDQGVEVGDRVRGVGVRQPVLELLDGDQVGDEAVGQMLDRPFSSVAQRDQRGPRIGGVHGGDEYG